MTNLHEFPCSIEHVLKNANDKGFGACQWHMGQRHSPHGGLWRALSQDTECAFAFKKSRARNAKTNLQKFFLNLPWPVCCIYGGHWFVWPRSTSSSHEGHSQFKPHSSVHSPVLYIFQVPSPVLCTASIPEPSPVSAPVPQPNFVSIPVPELSSVSTTVQESFRYMLLYKLTLIYIDQLLEVH